MEVSMAKISQKRLEMGEEAWAIYQKERKNAKAKRYADMHPEKKDRRKQSVVSARNKKKRLLVEYDFHHKDPNEKDFGISSPSGYGKSMTEVKLEVDKCLLLCRNCHAIEHDRLYKLKYNIEEGSVIVTETRL
jgi:predicted HNH restriction endonuclease